MNTISNEDDKATPAGYAELDAAITRISKINRAKLSIFPELVTMLRVYCAQLPCQSKDNGAQEMLVRAEKLIRDELP